MIPGPKQHVVVRHRDHTVHDPLQPVVSDDASRVFVHGDQATAGLFVLFRRVVGVLTRKPCHVTRYARRTDRDAGVGALSVPNDVARSQFRGAERAGVGGWAVGFELPGDLVTVDGGVVNGLIVDGDAPRNAAQVAVGRGLGRPLRTVPACAVSAKRSPFFWPMIKVSTFWAVSVDVGTKTGVMPKSASLPGV